MMRYVRFGNCVCYVRCVAYVACVAYVRACVCVCDCQTQKELDELHVIVQELTEKFEASEHEVTTQV